MKPVAEDVVDVAAEVGADWVITQVGAPVSIIEAADLFDEPVTEDGARDFLERPGHVMFLARANDNTPVGFVTGVEMRHPDKQPEIFVYELGVEDDWRRRGVATALLAALEAFVHESGCSGLWTATERDNSAALATYRSRGAHLDDDVVVATWEDAPGAP